MDHLALTQVAGLSIGDGAAVLGAGALAVAVVWRTVRQLRVRSGVMAGLRSPYSGVRVAAVQQAAELGLASAAPALLRSVRTESDSAVLAAIVTTVAARQWEPASTGKVVELRLWAKSYADRHLELRGGARTQQPPMLSGVAGAVPPPSLDPARAEEFRTRSDQVVLKQAGVADVAPLAEDGLGLDPDPDPLSPTRVLVTGAGGPAGVAVVQALRRLGHHVIAVDADPYAVGLRLADEQHTLPRFDSPDYIAALLRVATLTDAQALVCTVAEEYRSLIPAREYLEEAQLKTLMPSLEAVEMCVDKWAFAERMVEEDLPLATTALGSATGVPGPWIVKPRFGRGSRDVLACHSRSELAIALRTVPDPIVQTRLTGREFTADALVDPTGALVACSPRWRTETRGGISTRGTTFEDPEVANVVELVLKAVGLVGPANVQGFVTEDGAVTVHEVNPRFSGGLPLTLHAGADVVGEYLRSIFGLPARPERLTARPGVTMMRFFCEVYAE